MGALAYDLPEPLSPRIEEEIQRLQPVDYRVAALVLVPDVPEKGYRIAFATRQFGDMTGYEGSELAGRQMDWFQGPDTDPVALSDVLASVDAAEQAEIDLLTYTKAGVAFWSRLQLQPIVRRDDTLEGFAVYLTYAEKSRASYLSEAWQKIEDAWSETSAEDRR
jgi:PAS domain-containing protein